MRTVADQAQFVVQIVLANAVDVKAALDALAYVNLTRAALRGKVTA
jgi:hypothetical protein